jgi:very-short-patch-repair endonuclease
MDPVVALAQLGGIATRREWSKLIGVAAARAAIDRGLVQRLPRRQVGLLELDTAAATAAALGGIVSHLDAALHYGWKVKLPPDVPTITVPRGRNLPKDRPAARLFWADLPARDHADGVTTPLRTVVDCSRAYDRDIALCVADSALRSGRVTQSELIAAAEASPRTGRSRALWIARQASELAANPFESVLRSIALDLPGLTVRPQGWVGKAGRADLVDDQLLIAIEADSWEHHGAPDLFRRDVRRYTEFARLGWVVVRFVWEDVMYQQERVARHLEEVAAIRRRQLGAGTTTPGV